MGETTTEIELREHGHDATTETPDAPPEGTATPRRTLVRRVQPDRANRRLSIRTRLFAGFGVVVALLALVAILGVSRLASFYGVTQELGKDGKRGELIAELTARTGQMKEAAVHQMLLDGPARAKGRQHILDVTAQVQQAADALTAEAGAGGRNRDWLTTALTAFKTTLSDYAAAQQQRILDASRADALAFATDPSETGIGRYFSTIDDQLKAIHAAQNNDVSTVVDEAGSRYSSARAILLGAAILALLVGLTVAVLLARRLSRTLQFVVTAAGRLADGDLNARAKVKTRDEVGAIAAAFNVMAERLHDMVETERHQRAELQQTVADISAFASRVAQGDLTARAPVDAAGELRDLVRNLNRMAESLASISGEVKRGSHEMSGTAAQILAAVSQHNASTAEQAASIAQTSVTIDEVRASAEQAAERAGSLASQAGQAAAYSDEGARAVDSLLTGMDEIGGRVAHVAAEIRELALRSEAIGDITDTVKELAEQSNMLALNATIEAAKAGEQGRGFAVVADEVRKLAEQSKQATAQVQAILQEIRLATANAVRATEEGTRVVEDGRARAGETGQILEQMTAAIRETATVATRIAAGAKEQAIGMDQIGQAIVEVSTTTGQISASAAQTEEAAGSLTQLAERLASQTRRYRVDADVTPAAPPPHVGRRPRVPVAG